MSRTINPVPHGSPAINLCACRPPRTSDTSRNPSYHWESPGRKEDPIVNLTCVEPVETYAVRATLHTPSFRLPSIPVLLPNVDYREAGGPSGNYMEEVLGVCAPHSLLYRRIVALPAVDAQLALPLQLSPETVNKIPSWSITIST